MADDVKYGKYRSRDESGNLKVEFFGEPEAETPTPQPRGSSGASKKTGTSATEGEKE